MCSVYLKISIYFIYSSWPFSTTSRSALFVSALLSSAIQRRRSFFRIQILPILLNKRIPTTFLRTSLRLYAIRVQRFSPHLALRPISQFSLYFSSLASLVGLRFSKFCAYNIAHQNALRFHCAIQTKISEQFPYSSSRSYDIANNVEKVHFQLSFAALWVQT